jgi:hypothetical protein
MEDAVEVVAWRKGGRCDDFGENTKMHGIVPLLNHHPRLFGGDGFGVLNPCGDVHHSFWAGGIVSMTAVHPFPFFVDRCCCHPSNYNDSNQYYLVGTIATKQAERNSSLPHLTTCGKKKAANHRAVAMEAMKSIDGRYFAFPSEHRASDPAVNSSGIATCYTFTAVSM